MGGVLGLDLAPCLEVARAAGLPADLAAYFLSCLEAGTVLGFRDRSSELTT